MRGTRLLCWIAAAAALSLLGCSSGPTKRTRYPNVALTRVEGYSETGLASWYGEPYHGRPTASGEIYDMHGRTGAHRTLPLGTRVRVTSLENGRGAVARINDRGPFVDGRIIDVSLTLAKELGLVASGTMRVRIESLDEEGKPSAASDAGRAVAWQVGSFAVGDNARRLARKLGEDFEPVRVVEATIRGTLFYRVQVGRYTESEAADEEYAELLSMGFDPFPVQVP